MWDWALSLWGPHQRVLVSELMEQEDTQLVPRPVGCVETPHISCQGWALAVGCGRRNRKQSFFLLGLEFGRPS